MSEETSGSLGTAAIYVTANTSSLEAKIEAAKRTVSGLGTAAEAQFNKASASSKKYAESLLRQTEMLGKTRAEQIAFNAQTRLGGELGDKIAAKALANQALTATSLGGIGKSAKELQFAMRGLPAQVTDIFTSLAAGQRPLQVLLQQGGQLKDMFGGIKPAAAALGRSLLGLINPFTLAAAAVAAVAYAAYSGQEDIDELNAAVIKTGGYAGVTGRALNDMANQVGAATGKFGASRDAIKDLAGSGEFSGAGLGGLAKQAVDTAKVTGESMDKVVASIAKLNAKPAETIAALNEQYHFLTSAQYAQIAALEEQGRTQDAARLANKLDAEAMASRARDIEDNANWMVKSAHYVAAEWGKAWAAIKGAVTPAGLAEQASNLQAQIDTLSKPHLDRQGNLVQAQAGDQIAALKQQLADVRRQQVQSAFSDNERELQAGLNQDAIAAQQRLAKFAAPKDTLDSTLAKANKDRLAALYGVVDPTARAKIEAEYKTQVQQAREAYANATKDKGADFWNTPITGDGNADMAASLAKIIDGYKKEADQWARSTTAATAYKRTLDDMLDTRQRAIDLQVQSIGMGQREIEQQSALIAIDEDYNRKKADLQKRQQDATSQLDRDGYQKQLDDLAKYHDDRIRKEIDGWKREDEARKSAALGARAAIKDFEDDAGNVAGQTHELFSNAFDGMSDALATFVTTGKLNFKSLAASIVADMAKIEARILISQALQAIFGGSYGTGSGNASSVGVGESGKAVAFNPYAKGGVFANSPGLSEYSGQIVNHPTMFAFARGAGIMGEAGPEAIMPLRRGPDGRLGVAAAGGGMGDVYVDVTVTQSGDGSTTSKTDVTAMSQFGKQLGEQMKTVAQQVVQRALQPNGQIDKAMRQRAPA